MSEQTSSVLSFEIEIQFSDLISNSKSRYVRNLEGREMAGTNQFCIFCQIIRNPTTNTRLLHAFRRMRRWSRFKTSSPPLREHIPTVRDLQRRDEDYSLVTHMLSVGKEMLQNDAPQTLQRDTTCEDKASSFKGLTEERTRLTSFLGDSLSQKNVLLYSRIDLAPQVISSFWMDLPLNLKNQLFVWFLLCFFLVNKLCIRHIHNQQIFSLS
ncbi:uncharacterized protein LOC108852295 [Raphanus sativus]|uniref:Uncharacterized protein LOC108852295 n=1 Tax=Raphanus sativus TaxID=3726 RepID=A0A9W3CSB8_RAPSA|nr:uncharacterized protein LOC108852295 [Raphanus sativus]